MKVHGHGHQHSQAMGQLKPHQPQEEREGKHQLKEAIMSKLETKNAPQVAQSQGEAKGVIRLLQVGHFKGVADLRLQINFGEQLQNATIQAATNSLEVGGHELISNLEEKVLGLPETFDFVNDHVEGLMDTFKQIVETPSTSKDDGQFDVNFKTDKFRQAFDGLYNNLWILENGVEGAKAAVSDVPPYLPEASTIVSTETTEEETAETEVGLTDFQTALSGLKEWFDTELQSLEARVDKLLNLPPLTDPRGNGVAYDRFLKTYNQLYSPVEGQSPKAESTEENIIETNA